MRGVSDDAIETHPDFVSNIGGSATNPKNGAIFYNAQTGKTTDGKTAEASDDGYVFKEFAIIVGGSRNPFAKQEAYLNSSKLTWRKTSVTRASPNSATRAGRIDSPPGGAPGLSGGANWLNMGLSSTKQGAVYQVTEDWMASGPGGWNPLVYK